MKKRIWLIPALIAIAPSAFAQITFGGAVGASATLISGATEEIHGSVPDPRTSSNWDFEFNAGADGEDGNFGMRGQVTRQGFDWIYMWWKVTGRFFIAIGEVEEAGGWAGADITDRGLHANNFDALRPDYMLTPGGYAGNVLPSGNGFYRPELGNRAMQVSFYPADGLAINLGFPMESTVDENYIQELRAQAAYEFPGLGRLAVSFTNADKDNAKNIYAQWDMPIGGDMRIEAGARYGVAGSGQANEPLNIGFGFGRGSFEKNDKAVFNARAGAEIPMVETGRVTRVGLDAVFSYDLEVCRIYVPAGVGLRIPEGGDPAVAWNFGPYVTKRLAPGGPYVFGGVRLFNGRPNQLINNTNNPNSDIVNWAVPVGMRYEF